MAQPERFCMIAANQNRQVQSKEVLVLLLLYGLQVWNAEMLRRAFGHGHTAAGSRSLAREIVVMFSDYVHPLAMLILAIWFLVMGAALAGRQRIPRWAFDGAGLWFSFRLLVEFLTINLLVFKSSLVAPSILLGQIVVYLPYFILNWGWIFYRLDWVDNSTTGLVVSLSDIQVERSISPFDYFHSSMTTLLNKGKPTISGVNRLGRIVVLIYLTMLLMLYTVALTRILQLTRAAF